MKTYIVYINCNEVGKVKAGSLKSAEKKVAKRFGKCYGPVMDIFVVYTEEWAHEKKSKSN